MDPREHGARLFLLGRFAVEVEGRAVPASAWRKRRPIEVLTALAVAPGRLLHREELIDRLWPDKDLEAGANNLHRALHDLRRITGTELATLDRGVARLAESVWVDVEAFEQAAASTGKDALAQAVELYQGILLPDDPYSDALAARREGLRQLFIDAGLRLANLQHETSAAEACIGVLRRMLTQDPALEPAHQLLMRVLAETGRKGDALRQFAECSTALREHLDANPARATFDLRSAIERDEIAPRPRKEEPRADAVHVTRRLLGGDPLRPMHGARGGASSGVRVRRARARRAFVAGEAGLGKTRLAGECVRLAANSGAAVLVGTALDLDSGVPYAPFADAWAQHRRMARSFGRERSILVVRAVGRVGAGGPAEAVPVGGAMVEVLGHSGPVCIVIEDLHQADQSSLHLFHHLARATRSLPLLLVGTLREEEVQVGRALHTLLGSLGRERLATRIALERHRSRGHRASGRGAAGRDQGS